MRAVAHAYQAKLNPVSTTVSCGQDPGTAACRSALDGFPPNSAALDLKFVAGLSSRSGPGVSPLSGGSVAVVDVHTSALTPDGLQRQPAQWWGVPYAS